MPACFVCGDVIQKEDEYLAHLDMTCPTRYEGQGSRSGLVCHAANVHAINIEKQKLEFTNSDVKLANDAMDPDDGATNSCSTRSTREREKTSLVFQTLATMVPDMSEAVFAKIQDSAGNLLALARQPISGELSSRVPIEKAPGRSRKRRNLAKHQRVPLNMTKHLNRAEEIDMASIDDLPEEVLLEIMTYLNLSDRKSIRMVSKKWHRLSYDKKLIKTDVTNIRSSEYLNHISANSRHSNVRVHDNLELIKTMSFWEKHGEKVEAIEFRFVKGNHPALPQVLRCCPNVKHIIMKFTSSKSQSKFPFPPVPFPNLERLEMKYGSCDNYTVAALFIHSPKLKKLLIDLPEAEATKIEVLELIKNSSTTLKELDLRYLWAERDLTQIVENVGSQLIRLYLRDDTRALTDFSLNAIVKKYVKLQHLALIESQLSFSTIEHAITSLKDLTHLSLWGVDLSNAPRSLFIAIDNWTQLIAIDLRYTSVTAENIMIAFRSKHPKLLNLQLHGFGGMYDGEEYLFEICPNFPNLLVLGLRYSHLKGRHLRVIAQWNTHLEDFSLENSTVQRISTIFNDFKALKHLSLTGVEKSYAIVRELSLPELRTIDLRCTRTTSTDILQLVERNRSLYHVEVSKDMAPGFNNEIRGILERRRPNNPCRRRKEFF